MAETSLFGRVKEKFLAGKVKDQLAEMRQILHTAVRDGVISDEELESINRFYRESRLSEEDFARTRNGVFFNMVGEAIADHRITREEKEALYHVASRLKLSGDEIDELNQVIAYYTLLNAIETLPFEELPSAHRLDLRLHQGETDYFTTRAELFEEYVSPDDDKASSALPIMKGNSYHAGQASGLIQQGEGMVPLSDGQFTLTNQRMIFSGDGEYVDAEFDKIELFEMFSDGIRFAMAGSRKPVRVIFNDPQRAEILGLYLSRIMNQ
jgi:hypothetical protein